MTPSRGRPESLKRMAASARRTATRRIEIVAWLDACDPALGQNLRVCREENILFLLGPREVIHSSRWDRCLPLATGDLLFHLNDDVVLKTQGWDLMVEAEFDKYPDRILMVGGDDAYLRSETLVPHPIIHRRWLETLGYFIPPYFDGEWGDTWVSNLATRIGRMKFLPFVCEHLHFSRSERLTCPNCGRNDANASVSQGTYCNACGYLWGETRVDETARTYLARSQEQNPARIYIEKEPERTADAGKLKALLGTKWQ